MHFLPDFAINLFIDLRSDTSFSKCSKQDCDIKKFVPSGTHLSNVATLESISIVSKEMLAAAAFAQLIFFSQSEWEEISNPW